MPRLLTSKKKPSQKKPACGRKIDYQVPTSPWQKLIDRRREELNLSTRAVAEHLEMHPSSFWIWTHSKNGYPHPKSATKARLRALAAILKLDYTEMVAILDSSRALYTAREHPEPQAARDALLDLIQILENDRRARLDRAWVLNLARRIHDGAAPAATVELPTPVPRQR